MYYTSLYIIQLFYLDNSRKDNRYSDDKCDNFSFHASINKENKQRKKLMEKNAVLAILLSEKGKSP